VLFGNTPYTINRATLLRSVRKRGGNSIARQMRAT